MNKYQEIVKKAIFGMRRNRALNDEFLRSGFTDPSAPGMQPRVSPDTRSSYDFYRQKGFSHDDAMRSIAGNRQEMSDYRNNIANQEQAVQAQRSNPMYSANPQTRNRMIGTQVDQKLLQEKVDAQRQEAQNIQKERALANQFRSQGNNAWANYMGGQGGMPSRNQSNLALDQQKQREYLQAQQEAIRRYPELAQSGSAMNRAFLQQVQSAGGAEALKQNPALLASIAEQTHAQMNPPKAIPTGNMYPPSIGAPAQPEEALVENNTAPVPAQPPQPVQPIQQDQGNQPQETPAAPKPAPQATGGRVTFRGPSRRPVNPQVPYKGEPQQQPTQPIQPMQPTGTPTASNPPPQSVQPLGAQNNTNSLLNKPAVSNPNTFSGPTNLSIGGPNKSMTPKTARDKAMALDLSKEEIEETFRKEAAAYGLDELRTEMMLHELVQEKFASSKEERFMNYLKTELLKAAETLGEDCPYSPRELSNIAKDMESFQKAASAEAFFFWEGLKDSLTKMGKDQAFIDGILKEAEDVSDAVGALIPEGTGTNIMSTLGEGARNVLDTLSAKGSEAVKTVSDAAAPIGESAGKALSAAKETGSAVANAASSLGGTAREAASNVMDTVGETARNIGTHVAPVVENTQKKLQELAGKGKDFLSNITSPLSNEDDRHRIIPTMGNQFVGAAGGALLSSLLGGQLGLSGPAAWLLPLLGGAAGYHYLPKLMNMWKDAPNTGVNQLPSSVQNYYQQNPVTPAPAQ